MGIGVAASIGRGVTEAIVFVFSAAGSQPLKSVVANKSASVSNGCNESFIKEGIERVIAIPCVLNFISGGFAFSAGPRRV